MGKLDCLVWLGLKQGPPGSTIDGVVTWRMLIAEYLGTLLLVFFGTMLAVAPGNVDPISGPFAGGLALACIVQALAHVSGAMVNPAMSLGFFTCRRISFIKLCLFSLAQCAGAISGSALLKAVTPSTNHALHAMGSTTLAPGVTIFHGICIEIMITFLLVFLTVSATDGRRVDVTGSIPLIIGLAIVACSFAAGPFTGASMNPARSLGPAVISGYWEHQYVYWIGPLIGGALGGLIYAVLFDAKYFEKSEDLTQETPRPFDDETHFGSQGHYAEGKGSKY